MSRRNRHGLQRRQNRRNLRKTFLIVCEGSKTEPNYFEGFRVPREIYDVKGMGDNTIRLVREAIKLKEQGNYDQVWVVMDKDDFPVDHFNGAIEMARAKNICVAYSNEAFELWYLLHFDYHDTAVSRRTYRERLSRCLGFSYEKMILECMNCLRIDSPAPCKMHRDCLMSTKTTPDLPTTIHQQQFTIWLNN